MSDLQPIRVLRPDYTPEKVYALLVNLARWNASYAVVRRLRESGYEGRIGKRTIRAEGGFELGAAEFCDLKGAIERLPEPYQGMIRERYGWRWKSGESYARSKRTRLQVVVDQVWTGVRMLIEDLCGVSCADAEAWCAEKRGKAGRK